MTQARSNLISIADTPYYHIINRCVRRAYLFGDDPITGQNFDHRKQWLVSRLKYLATVHTIDICAYAIMSNHYHLVVRIDDKLANNLSNTEVIERWTTLYKGNILTNRYLADKNAMSDAEISKTEEIIAEWRTRLSSISWLMRNLNETIARMANKEDKVSGRFWQGRFKSQALLNDEALLRAMTYVDLNPIRAGMEDSLENSDFTSIQERLITTNKATQSANKDLDKILKHKENKQLANIKAIGLEDLPAVDLLGFSDGCDDDLIPFTQLQYIELVQTTGKIIRADKNGSIPDYQSPILVSMGIEIGSWLDYINKFNENVVCIGGDEELKKFATNNDKSWVWCGNTQSVA